MTGWARRAEVDVMLSDLAHSTAALASIIRRVDAALPDVAGIRGLHDVLLDIRLDAMSALKEVGRG